MSSPNFAPVSRRRFLYYVGAGAASLFTRGLWAEKMAPPIPRGAFIGADGRPAFSPRRHPVPLPTDLHPPGEDKKLLATFEVVDDLLLPEGFEYRVLAQSGELFGPAASPERQIRFGYNNDYTGLLPIPGMAGHYYLMVNHEYVAFRPWLQGHEEVFGSKPPALELLPHPKPEAYAKGLFRWGGFAFDGPLFEGNTVDWSNPAAREAVPAAVRAEIRQMAERVLSQVGISILHLRRLGDGAFEVVREAADHRRITAIGRENVAGSPAEHSSFTGPAALFFAKPPSGTMCNCSGGTTPWGTFLTCEENIFNEVNEEITPAGEPLERKKLFGALAERSNNVWVFNHPLPPTLTGNGHVLAEPLDGREYGWVCEVDPENGHLRKHTALGRFRHENVAVRCEAGKRLAAYMGDDRRGGHVFKYVSDEVAKDPASPDSRKLLEKGTLYVARFEPGFHGTWIPLRPETRLRRPEPEQCFTQHVKVPSRFTPRGGPVAIGDPERDNPDIAVDAWIETVESFVFEKTGQRKKFADCKLGDLVEAPGASSPAEAAARKQGVILMEAFLMANACGGTPSARPEDLEVHPFDRTVYIAFTESSGSSDGSPDRRIFPDSDATNSRQYGAIYRLLEGGIEGPDSDPAATTFTWGRFLGSGEVAEKGNGFGYADNLAFDPQGHLWMVTDITTTAQNFPTRRRREDGSQPGGLNFGGIFGNNAMFAIPAHGESAGLPFLFATGPMDCELCGPSFCEDGLTLILSVQHPGELDGMGIDGKPPEEREHLLLDREGKTFVQKRKVPIGSNFPHGQKNRAPRPAVVYIRRKAPV